MMRIGTAALAAIGITAMLGAAEAWADSTVYVPYAAGTPESNFGTPSPTTDAVPYNVVTSQDMTNLYVNVIQAPGGNLADAGAFSNIYLGGDTSVGFEVTNDRAFIPGGNGTYFVLAGTGFTYSATGDLADGTLNIGFVLPFTFLETDPLNMGFNKLTSDPANNFTRVSLSQSFGYSVAGGQTNFGTNRLGAFTVPAPATVPEPSSGALLAVGLLGAAMIFRRRSRV